MKSRPLAGIFVGGRSSRMGGQPKGLLVAPDGRRVIERTIALLRQCACDTVLVGNLPAYSALGLPCLDDDLPGVGPMGGLTALLRFARGRKTLAIACDLPFLEVPLLARLATEAGNARILAPRVDGRWEPMFARYDAAVLPAVLRRIAAGRLSLQGVLDECGAVELPLDASERTLLRDWDEPADVASEADRPHPIR